jgi:pimeloyl-ACP methyl ester carboxylesterase
MVGNTVRSPSHLRALRNEAQPPFRYSVGMSTRATSYQGLLGEDRLITTPDGRRIYTMVRGNGPDLVVLEAGLGISGLYWGPVHELLAAHTRVVAYERAGYGESDPDDHPRTLARLAADLDTVIGAFPHRRLVLVGHSWGGPIVRVVGALRLKRGQPVTGLVLADQSDENSELYFSNSARRQFSAQASLMEPLARLRILGPLFRKTIVGLQDPLLSAAVSASCSRPAARATAAEIRHVVDGLEGLRDVPATLGELPIRVISGQRAGVLDRKVRASIIQAHEETVAQNAGASFVPADRSAHMVPITEPGLVASEALTLFTE